MDFINVKGAVIDGVIYDELQVTRLANLPPLPMVRAQFLSMLQAPASRIAGVLAGSIRQVVSVLKAYSEAEPAVA